MLGVEDVTCKVHCHQCGTILYEGRELKPPYEIIKELEGRCPNCYRKLAVIPVTFEVIPIE